MIQQQSQLNPIQDQMQSSIQVQVKAKTNRDGILKSIGYPENQPTIRYSGVKNKESSDFPTYLQNSFSQTIPKTPKEISKIPQQPCFALGMSEESPSYFSSKHSIYFKNSYKNPYIPKLHDLQTNSQQSKRNSLSTNKLLDEAKRKVESSKNNLNNTQTFDIFTPSASDQHFFTKNIPSSSSYDLVTHTQKDRKEFVLQINEKPKFSETYHSLNQNSQSPNPFHQKRDMFSEFVEKNDIMKVYAPLLQLERPRGDFKETKNYSINELEMKKKKTLRILRKSSFNRSDSMSSSAMSQSQPGDQDDFVLDNQKGIQLQKQFSLTSNSALTRSKTGLTFQSKSEDFDEQAYEEQLNERTTRKNFHTKNAKTLPLVQKDWVNRLKNISLAVPKPILVADTDRFYQRDQKYLNNIDNNIVRDSINQRINEAFFKSKQQPYTKQRIVYKPQVLIKTEEERNKDLVEELNSSSEQKNTYQGNQFFRTISSTWKKALPA